MYPASKSQLEAEHPTNLVFGVEETHPFGLGLAVGGSAIRFIRKFIPLPSAVFGGGPPNMPDIPIGIPVGWPGMYETIFQQNKNGQPAQRQGGKGEGRAHVIIIRLTWSVGPQQFNHTQYAPTEAVSARRSTGVSQQRHHRHSGAKFTYDFPMINAVGTTVQLDSLAKRLSIGQVLNVKMRSPCQNSYS